MAELDVEFNAYIANRVYPRNAAITGYLTCQKSYWALPNTRQRTEATTTTVLNAC